MRRFPWRLTLAIMTAGIYTAFLLFELLETDSKLGFYILTLAAISFMAITINAMRVLWYRILD